MTKNFKQIILRAPAKINVYLGVTGKRPDGYHDIDSVMQTVGVCDIVKVCVSEEPNAQSINVRCPGHTGLDGEGNIAYRAAKAFLNRAKIEKYEIDVEIEKVIPMEAGLGGGSSDAAAVILALNELYSAGFSVSELMEMGATVGADVPFLIHKGTAFVQGIGEKIVPCKNMPAATVLLAYPHTEKVSTGKAYKAIDDGGEFTPTERFEEMKNAIEMSDTDMIAKAAYNIFETVLPEGSVVFEIKKAMLESGAEYSLMSGSGSAVFGVFLDTEKANKAAKALETLAKTFVTEFC